jgi:site-specific DNA recombinase
MRAAIYSRFSTDRQNESSIADQVRLCTEHAERQGWQIVERYADQGISGAALGNRPDVLRLQEAALARRLDVVLVTDLTRLSRSQGDLAKMIDRLVAKGVRVVGVQDGYDSARRGHKLQAGLSGIIGEAFREMVKDRTYAALESRAKDGKATGGRAYGYRGSSVHRDEARVVREIFARYADGGSCKTIAAELNGRRVPSPGSTWNRTERRRSGWMGSGIRALLRNERYRGVVHWNVCEWHKDPDTGKRRRVVRPRDQWITRIEESLRIVSDELWQRAQRRMNPAPGDMRLKAGGRPKYLLSGLLRCDVCGSNFTIVDSRSYGCPSHRDGNACSNAVQVRKDHIENVLLRGSETGLAALLAPERVERMGNEMQRYYADRMRALQTHATEAPRELQELGARIERLRDRLRRGDPDMTPDEIEAAIARAESKRRELENAQPAAKMSMKVLAILPRAAELYRQQVMDGLDGNPRAALKARVFLKEWFGGKVRLEPLPDGGLMAHWNQNTTALWRACEHVVAGAGFEPATFGL